MNPGLTKQEMPRHVAIIMDGNGRWGQARGLARTAGHKAGADAMRRITRLSSQWGVEVLTLFAFSTENWKRPAEEVSFLFDLLRGWIRRETQELVRNGVRLGIIGDETRLPADVRAEIARAVEATHACTGMVLCIALSYGGRDEIIRAVRKLAGIAPEDITEEAFSQALDTAGLPDVDLLIRTSEMRVSGFLPWQAAYAELVFHEGYWPDFDEPTYAECLRQYATRKRRFGEVKP